MEASRKSKSVLVVGAGIAGAVYSDRHWAGMKATLVSAGPARQPGHRFDCRDCPWIGPPGEPVALVPAPAGSADERGEAGQVRVQPVAGSVTWRNPPSGLARYPHQVQDLEDTSPTHTNQLVATLQDAGSLPVEFPKAKARLWSVTVTRSSTHAA